MLLMRSALRVSCHSYKGVVRIRVPIVASCTRNDRPGRFNQHTTHLHGAVHTSSAGSRGSAFSGTFCVLECEADWCEVSGTKILSFFTCGKFERTWGPDTAMVKGGCLFAMSEMPPAQHPFIVALRLLV